MPIDDEKIITREKLYELLTETKDTVNNMQQTLNNGIKEKVNENSDCIDNLRGEVTQISKKIDDNHQQRKGREHYKSNLGWYISAVLAIVTILSLTGVF